MIDSIIYNRHNIKKLAAGLGSSPSVANIIGFLSNTIISGFTYDAIKHLFVKGNGDYMKKVIKVIMILGLGCCGDMV